MYIDCMIESYLASNSPTERRSDVKVDSCYYWFIQSNDSMVYNAHSFEYICVCCVCSIQHRLHCNARRKTEKESERPDEVRQSDESKCKEKSKFKKINAVHMVRAREMSIQCLL